MNKVSTKFSQWFRKYIINCTYMSGSVLGAGDTAVTRTETNHPANKYIMTNCDKNSEGVQKAD